MLVFSRDVINEALRTTSVLAPYYPNTVNGLPSHHGGEIGGSLEDLIISLLDLHHRETFGDIGCGRGKFLFRMKLTYQANSCFGVEIDSPRVRYGIYWWIHVYMKLFSLVSNLSRNPLSRRCPSAPKLLHHDITSVDFWRRFGFSWFSSRKLKLFFNNFGGHMLNDGIQDELELKLHHYCRSGTLIVSLSEMFLDRESKNLWSNVSVVKHVIAPGDVSWSDGGNGQEIKVFVYVKN